MEQVVDIFPSTLPGRTKHRMMVKYSKKCLRHSLQSMTLESTYVSALNSPDFCVLGVRVGTEQSKEDLSLVGNSSEH